ncbi:MAG TPA: hypothetical protein VMS89_08065 [Methanoregulaceae archaeon]|nr:hypothetical protein [Methanoregulaceae archaeon]
MTAVSQGTPYRELAKLADSLFKASGDDEERLASHLDTVSTDLRHELFVSDLLNAYQVFYYFFRESPGDLGKERMILAPASLLVHGMAILEVDYLEVIFSMDPDEPVITVRDEGQVLANYRGKTAYRDAMQFIDESL